MQLFNIGVNPLLQLLESKLQGITMYSTPQAGPIEKDRVSIPDLKQNEKLVAYVDDIMPFLTKEEEFYILDICLKLFEQQVGADFIAIHCLKNALLCLLVIDGKKRSIIIVHCPSFR